MSQTSDAHPPTLTVTPETLPAVGTAEALVLGVWAMIAEVHRDGSPCSVLFRGDFGPSGLLPFVAAVGVVLLGELTGRTVCAVLPPRLLGVPGTALTLRAFVRLNLLTAGGGAGKISPLDVAEFVFRLSRIYADPGP